MIDENTLTEYYNNLSRELFVYIYRFIGSKETSEDILQDIFLNLIRYSKKNEVKAESIRAFLYRTAHNLCVNYIKRSKKIEFKTLSDEDRVLTGDKTVEKLEREELTKKIYQLLEGVDSLSRSMFIMKKELNLKVKEISRNTGKSERTVRRRLNWVLQYLAEALEKSGFKLEN